mmetsp:Transcript_85038/g.264201  ORF Transcript_85038/g.264201 Transcript_85038/m.264201 type:complete len:155 (+) Transcript_85038:92-556(+)
MMSFAALRVLAVACLAVQAAGTRRAAEHRAAATSEMKSAAEWWPFSLAAGTPEPPKPTPAAPRLEDAKDRVMLSATFGRKVAGLCREAGPDEMQKCRRLAGERLFCALLRRHAERFEGFTGVAEAHSRCQETDIMETALEAARDEQLQEMAKDA